MKKSLLNIAVTVALGSAVFSGSVMSTQAYADELVADNNTSNNSSTETYLYPGMGVGAASGALVAGPVGMLVGGLIGAIAGANTDTSQETSNTAEAMPVLSENTVQENIVLPETVEPAKEQHSVQVAQLGEINTVVETPVESQQHALLDVLTTDLSLDVYFRSGSDNIESFYPARLAAIAKLMNTMDELELHLDGYTDRRGDKTKNIALANQRIEKVREQLINAGVDENRIVSKAFGEIKMVSQAGDLEAYTFDRKVVIRFQRITADSIAAMNTALSKVEDATKTKDTNAVIADSRIEF